MPPAAEPPIQSAPSLPVIGQETVDNASGGTPAPETTSPPSINKHWTQALDEIDLPDKEAPKAPPAKAPEAKAPEPEKAKPKEAPKTETKQPEKKVEPAAEPKDELPPFRTNQELRKWAKDRHVAATVSEKKLAEYEAKLKELESRVPKTEQGAELVAQQIVEAKKKIESYERIIEMQAFEHSEKYRKEYYDPWWNAMSKAEKEVGELLITEPTGEQEPTGEMDADGNPKMRAKMRQRPAS